MYRAGLFMSLVILMGSVCIPSFSHAQVFTTSQDVSFTIDPIMPVPGEQVTASLSSNVYDLDSFMITWSLNGQVVQQAMGQTTFQTEAPPLRSARNVVEAALEIDGRVVRKTIQVQGRTVPLLEQSVNTTYFPGYRGRRVPAQEEDMRIVAIPDESFSGNVNYTWDKNYIDGLPELSGTGKNYFIIPATIFTDISTIGIEVEDLITRRRMKSYRDISFTPQSVAFYSFTRGGNPNFLKQESGSYELSVTKIINSLMAYPFGYNTSYFKNPEIRWFVNSQPLEGYENNLIIPFKKDIDSGGTAEIMVEVEPSDSLSQFASSGLTVSY